jgi:acetyl esterase/lipase
MPGAHAIVLPGGGYQVHAPHEAEPIAAWLESLGLSASVFRYPLNTRHPAPLNAVRAEIAARRSQRTPRVGVVGFSAGGHLGGHAALASEPGDPGRPDFALLGYAITSMETDTYKPAQDILLGPEASASLRQQTSQDRLAHPGAPPFFIWHTAEDSYVPPEHS